MNDQLRDALDKIDILKSELNNIDKQCQILQADNK